MPLKVQKPAAPWRNGFGYILRLYKEAVFGIPLKGGTQRYRPTECQISRAPYGPESEHKTGSKS